MRRREVIALIAGAIAWPLGVRAQPQKVARIGFLTAGSLAMRSELIDGESVIIGVRPVVLLGEAPFYPAGGHRAAGGSGGIETDIGEKRLP
jgi:hypothetical protein